MSVDALSSRAYTDIQGLSDLKRQARANDPAAMRETARQFETLFAKMMLQSMREASMGDEIFDTQESQMYRGMFDDQMALELTRGKGLGVADMMVQQLMKAEIAAQAAAAGETGQAPLAPTLERITPNLAPTLERIVPIRQQSLQPSAPVLNVLPTSMSELRSAPVDSVRATTATSELPPQAGSRRAFLESILPAAEKAAQALGVSPRAIMAQAALESGWGRAMPTDASGRSSFNLFGIKATGSWQGASVASETTEYVGGRAMRAVESFRAYHNYEASVADHARLLSRSPRYAEALNSGEDVGAYASALQRGGYATDPNYARKLVAVAESIDRILNERNVPMTATARS